MSLADFHIHSNASDGTDSAETLIKKLHDLNIKYFSITDHDTIKNSVKCLDTPGFIIGIEFSCHYNYNKIHILGLNFNHKNKYFIEALNAGDELRHKKFFTRIKFLHDNFNINFSDSEIEELLKTPSVGKPHLVNFLVEKNYANDKLQAFHMLDKCNTKNDKLDSDFVIKSILKADGIPVWAHPLGGEGENILPEDIFNSQLQTLISNGLMGLECFYSKYDYDTCLKLSKTAKLNNLLVSGGSDYHGSNKKIPLAKLNSDNIPVQHDNLSIVQYLTKGIL